MQVLIVVIIICSIIYLPLWAAILVSLSTIIIIGIPVLLIGYQPPGKAEIAATIKGILGYDFGNDFQLLFTGSHDYEEYMYIFPKEGFERLKTHLESMEDMEESIKGAVRSIRHEYKGVSGAGFTLEDDRMGEKLCGNIESIEVDYQERTLKHTFVVF